MSLKLINIQYMLECSIWLYLTCYVDKCKKVRENKVSCTTSDSPQNKNHKCVDMKKYIDTKLELPVLRLLQPLLSTS